MFINCCIAMQTSNKLLTGFLPGFGRWMSVVLTIFDESKIPLISFRGKHGNGSTFPSPCVGRRVWVAILAPSGCRLCSMKADCFLAEMIRDMDRYGLVWKYGTAPRYAMCFLGTCRWFSDGIGMASPPLTKLLHPRIWWWTSAERSPAGCACGFQLIWCGIPMYTPLGDHS